MKGRSRHIDKGLRRLRSRLLSAVILVGGFLLFLLGVPGIRFDQPCSTVLLDRHGQLLGATVAADEQWRFRGGGPLPDKYRRALLCYEDRHFYRHPGVNPVALARALYRNLRAGAVVSGGSTITMQLARLSRGHPSRSYGEKALEILMALKAECLHSKETLLRMYATHAPFGGNVVGLEAACWRFFGSGPGQLSWGQAATLAVLPNAPALIFPGRNQEALRRKRDRLLQALWRRGDLDSVSCRLAMLEPVPGPPHELPQLAPELGARLVGEGLQGQRLPTTLDAGLQEQVSAIIGRYHRLYRGNGIYNAAALVLDLGSGDALAYVGNTADTGQARGGQVDIITAPRSYGSVLKPLLYLSALDEGRICPASLLPDYPASFAGFSPQNFNTGFEGLAPADQVLIRSLNVPSVFLLQQYRTQRFLEQLRTMGFTSFGQPAAHYGLSLILGGGEASLWEVTGAYAALGRRLAPPHPARFRTRFLQAPRGDSLGALFRVGQFSAAAIKTTFDVLSELYRPGDDGHWQQFSSTQRIAWKTGTSFGNRDAWAVGLTPRYAVGVWVGNASGEGRPGLTGASHAAPILFDIFSLLPDGGWFQDPARGWARVALCRQSGFRASPRCPDTVWRRVPAACATAPRCTYHQRIHLDPSGQYRVSGACADPAAMISRSWFVLTPIEEWYYRQHHSDYRPLPPVRKDCAAPGAAEGVMTLVYPADGAKIFIPREREGEQGRTVFRVAHRDAGATIYWHMDGHYLGRTTGTHVMELSADAGTHSFTLVDPRGTMLRFQVTFLQEGGP